MCSIAGCAGPIHKLPKKLQIEHHEFLSCLFTMAELRGRDAAGFWVWRGDHYVYEKRPIPAEDLIQRSPRWKGLRFNPGSLYLLHTRAATDGDPNENINNHPHMGDHSVMIHNGMIWGHNAIATQYNLQMKTDCDSEVLLRLAEVMDDMKDGLKFMYEIASDSHGTDSIATAFVDRRNPNEILLSRNSGSPCYIYESKRFECTFFVSKEDIFERALDMLYRTRNSKVIGAKGKSIDTHWLYHLRADGTVNKEFLVQPQNKYAGAFRHDYDKEEDTAAIKTAYYIKSLFGHKRMSVDITGKMKLIVEDEEEKDIPEDNSDIEFMEGLEMPIGVENNLRTFLEKKIAEGYN